MIQPLWFCALACARTALHLTRPALLAAALVLPAATARTSHAQTPLPPLLETETQAAAPLGDVPPEEYGLPPAEIHSYLHDPHVYIDREPADPYAGGGYICSTEYGCYRPVIDAPWAVELRVGGTSPTSGIFARAATTGYNFRVSGLHPFKVGTIRHRDIVFSLAASYEFTDYDTKSGLIPIAFGQPSVARFFTVDDLSTHLFGVGPDVQYFIPIGENGCRIMLGARFEGLGGYGFSTSEEVMTLTPVGDEADDDAIWGLRGEFTAGLHFANDVKLSGTFGLSKYRTDIITGVQENSDARYFTINLEMPLEMVGDTVCWWRR